MKIFVQLIFSKKNSMIQNYGKPYFCNLDLINCVFDYAKIF